MVTHLASQRKAHLRWSGWLNMARQPPARPARTRRRRRQEEDAMLSDRDTGKKWRLLQGCQTPQKVEK